MTVHSALASANRADVSSPKRRPRKINKVKRPSRLHEPDDWALTGTPLLVQQHRAMTSTPHIAAAHDHSGQ
jgi:hypothetical protein